MTERPAVTAPGGTDSSAIGVPQAQEGIRPDRRSLSSLRDPDSKLSGLPVTITAAIIAQDEERNLSELLPRLGWADQVVVVDGGSRDRTVQVAREAGCTVLCHEFDTFARQRNRAIGLARGEWVLSIDADERPTRELIREIRRRIAGRRCAAYRVPIRSTIFGRRVRYGGTQDDCPVRLFRRDAVRWTGSVHEVLEWSGRVGRLESWLEHHTLPDLASFLAKVHRYTLLEASERVRRGERPAAWARWSAPVREVFRRLVWKQGILDGPAGWAFCLLSGLSAWVLADRHARGWPLERRPSPQVVSPHPLICIPETTL